jgi:tagatose 6-phosphate kinase
MIVCVGTTPVLQRSMVFGRLRPNDVNRAAAVYDYASGKSINVARVLHTLGRDVMAVGFAGGGRGEAMLADLRRAGIANEFVEVAAAETRQCVTVIDRAAGAATELVEESKPLPSEAWARLASALDRLLPTAGACVLSGSLPPDAPQDFYLACLRRLRPGAPVVLDARGEPLRRALAHGNFVAKMNRDELATTVGRPPDSDDRLPGAMRDVMPPGGSVVVTAGPHTVLAADAGRAWQITPPRVVAKSAVGSGDAFAAGMIVALTDGEPIADACALGAACGAANAMTDLAGFLSPDDVRRLRRQVRVEQIESIAAPRSLPPGASSG